MTRRVVVTGMGTVNPLGNNVKDFWRAIRAGENGIGALDRFDSLLFAAPTAHFLLTWLSGANFLR